MGGGQLESENLAIFCDFENLALGVEDARYAKFDIKLVIEKLLLKGSIVVKKAYCDWDRYKAFKAPMHEAAFEMIEIPHIRMSGKNSADIRLVVAALDSFGDAVCSAFFFALRFVLRALGSLRTRSS